ncbi:hypothetical protein DVA67_017675 [Solirubrobacter sp. CPCC 204708]|uniref:Restriction endonuclease n=1 Tax=Solirubrobacter deserti TaxID=2282478 RepID=A0ABT4RCZ1_9ACTN|nr:hypothetical protein [Solirubrobacter deserti]MBE2317816.1 hypothetical protein [Solirubrobacter deserti]MDA0136407.1 hypothetical protein [Solirubrobacter deserti]
MRTVETPRTAAEIAEAKHAADLDFAAAVEEGFKDVLVKSGLANEDGGPDLSVCADKVYAEIKTKHVSNIGENDDRFSPATSSSREELTRVVVTEAPTPAEIEHDEVHAAIWKKCHSLIWNLTATNGDRGRVQKKLDADKLILVRGKVYRNGNTIKDGIYVSTHEEVVLREFIGPHLVKMRKLAEALEVDFEMAAERSPALAAPMRAAIERALIEVSATLPVPTLGSGESNGRKALGA